MFGWTGKVLRVDLSKRSLSIEEPGLDFYKILFGGRALISYYLLSESHSGVDPLGADNILIFATGPITGAPVSGSGRHGVGAKSPLTGGIASSEAGGFWGAELKHAGFDAIVIKGVSPFPVFLSIDGNNAELRDAKSIWGMETLEAYLWLKENLGEEHARVALIGPAGEKGVRFANIVFDLRSFAGRGGLGAVMGAKRLKAIAIHASRGKSGMKSAEPAAIMSLSKWMVENANLMIDLHETGTSGNLGPVNYMGALPTYNFREGQFEGADRISGERLLDGLLIGRETCYACIVRCKRKVEQESPYSISSRYGGPEYETIAGFGSNLGIDDLDTLTYANMRCTAMGLDTISTSSTIAFAFECFEHGVIDEDHTGGKQIPFGDKQAMIWLIECIGHRVGIGNLLSEGVRRAAEAIGNGADQFALHVKSQELPLHEPRFKQAMGLGYAVSPTGADHEHNIHDTDFTQVTGALKRIQSFGDFEPMKLDDLSPSKVKLFTYHTNWQHLMDCLVMCRFLPYNVEQIVGLVQGVTSYNADKWELLRVGERAATLSRLYNLREGFDKDQDWLPNRFFSPLLKGPLSGIAIDPRAFQFARENYYKLMGWDENGIPTRSRINSLSLDDYKIILS